MLRDYRKGQRLSGATIKRLSLANPRLSGDFSAGISDYRPEYRDYSATIPAESATIPRLLETRCPNFRAAFLIVGELAVANQCVVPLS